MHNNFYFLRQISRQLNTQLTGFTVVSCFSQNKDELVLEFNDASRSFFLKADLRGDFSCLTFPHTFHRARKNSIDLFEPVVMKKVVAIRQFENERAFSIHLQEGLGILFKMHGNKSNVILTVDGVPTQLFKNSLVHDLSRREDEMDRVIDFSKEAFVAHQSDLRKLYITFGERVWSHAPAILDLNLTIDARWEELQRVLKDLSEPTYSVAGEGSKLYLTLLPFTTSATTFRDPFEAVNHFYYSYVGRVSYDRKRSSMLGQLKASIAATESWLEKTNVKLGELTHDDHYRQWGDLVMANLHAIAPESSTVELDDFYHAGKKVLIKLDPRLSAQKNAERFYRKAKNQQIEVTKLNESLQSRTLELDTRRKMLAAVEAAQDLATLDKLASGSKELTRAEDRPAVPYREFEFKGFRIWVGKDARTNDELTLKYSFKEDLWLHVRDDTGSHVLLKHQAGKPFPKDVIEYAASLAAAHSKRKTETLCAVIVTPKKFVRKRKGAPAGKVVVEREEVVLVKPLGGNR